MIRQSETLAKLAPALVAAQAEMSNAPKETKGQVGNQVRWYTDLPTITDLVRPILARNGLCFAQFPSSGGDGVVTVATRILHTSGEWLEDEVSMPCGSNGAQGVGSAITYAKRYSLMAVLGVAADDDDGAAASSSPPARARATAKPPAPKVISAGQRRLMFASARSAGMSDDALRLLVAHNNNGEPSTENLTVEAFDAVVHAIGKAPGVTAPGGAPKPSAARGPQKTGGPPEAAGSGDAGAAGGEPPPPATPEATPEARWADLVAYADNLGVTAAGLKAALRHRGLVTGPAGLADDTEYERARATVEAAAAKEATS